MRNILGAMFQEKILSYELKTIDCPVVAQRDTSLQYFLKEANKSIADKWQFFLFIQF